MDSQEKRLRRAVPRQPEVPVGEALLVERSVGEPAPAPVSTRSSLLQPQQERNIVWRWHVRRRRPRP